MSGPRLIVSSSLPQALKTKYVIINRAPIMMAWAFVVAERLGFQREEALSIGGSSFHVPEAGTAMVAQPLWL